MDDIKKQQLKRINRVVNKVADDIEQVQSRKQLDDLYKRRNVLVQKIAKNQLNIQVLQQQIQDVNDSIKLVQENVDLSKEADLHVDEAAARSFIKDNPDVFESAKDFINQNDALDELENELYGKK